MPLLSIDTNIAMDSTDAKDFLQSASKIVAGMLGKPERYVMVKLENNPNMLFDGNDFLISRKYPIHLIDRVGGGDSFGAGLIHGLLKGWDKKQVLEFAVAASALKQTIPGDMNLVNEDEVLTVVKGDISGRVQR